MLQVFGAFLDELAVEFHIELDALQADARRQECTVIVPPPDVVPGRCMSLG